MTATLNITPLPDPKPASFTGAVGKFTLEARINSDKLRTNEAASITTIITGTGNIKYVKSPELDLPIDFEQYTPSEDVRTHVSGNTVTGTVTSEYTFVPQSVGTFTIKPIEFSYFDLTKKEYVTLTSGGYVLEVARGANTTTGVSEQNEIRQRATDILHIHSLSDNSLSTTYSPTIHSISFWISWIVVIVIATAGLFLHRRQLRLNADVIGRKTARAGRVAKKRLHRAKNFMESGNREAFYAEILSALWGYISDRLAIPVADLNRNNISEQLSAHGMNNEDITRIINLFDECEMARYTPESSMRSMTDIYNDASQSMDTLESIKKKK